MTREHKLSLIIGVTVVLLVFVLLTDHMSRERTTPYAAVGQEDSLGTNDLFPSEPIRLVDMSGPVQDQPIGMHYRSNTASATPTVAAASNPSLDQVEPGLRRDPVSPTSTPKDTPTERSWTLDRAADIGSQFAQAIKGSIENASTAAQTDRITQNGAVPERLMPPKFDLEPKTVATRGSTEPTIISMDPMSRLHPTGEKSKDEMTNWEFRTVLKDESLFAIAQEYYGNGNEWRRIAAFNTDKVTSNGSVRQGVKLRIPLGPDAIVATNNAKPKTAGPSVEAKSKSAPQRSEIRTASTPSRDTTRQYTVRKNDTLGHIAQRELGSVRHMSDLLRANNLDKDDVIVAGMTLQIPIQ